MNRAFCFVVFLAVMGLSSSVALAREATPAADFLTPDPADCQVQPRTVENLTRLLATPVTSEATPDPARFVAPEGEPASDAAIAGVTATVNEMYACVNANAFLRMFSLYTDSLLSRMLVSEDVAPEALGLFATPVPPEAAVDRTSVAVRDVEVLADGRVGAWVVSHSPLGDGSDVTSYLIFIEQDGRYLVDDMVTLPAGSAQGTPAAG